MAVFVMVNFKLDRMIVINHSYIEEYIMWKFIKNDYRIDQQMLDESLFMVGNGYIGVRGCFEEGYPEGETIRGTYINGLYDRVPMLHAEMAYGFPTEQDKQPRLIDTQTCEICLDNEPVRLTFGKYEHFNREIDYKMGEVKRSYTYRTDSGKKANIMFKRLASFTSRNHLVYKIDVQYEGKIELVSYCDTDVENYSNPNDPRTGQSHTKLMTCLDLDFQDETVYALMQTKTTQIKQLTRVNHIVKTDQTYSMAHTKHDTCIETRIVGAKNLSLEKICFFEDSLRDNDLATKVKALKTQETQTYDYDYFSDQQRLFLESFWNKSEILIEGDDLDQNAIRFMQYQLLQSVGTDENANISAKGLSGEGYEGHYFWDTEIYVIPVMLFTQPERAKSLLEYRYHILPYAKERAKALGHEKGASYAWRTISGIECSGYFPAGTAQYHINADIAYAFVQYYLYTKDLDFILEMGAEVIFETARIWMEIGHFYEGTFQIHDVTGPDEYTAIVNNNYYTNAMAKYHLMWANRFYDLLKNTPHQHTHDKAMLLFEKIGISDAEVALMRKASNQMYFSFDEKRQLYAQDDSFLSKPRWPFEKADPLKKPLLLHYHPLTIYRHQVLKQADTVLAHFLLDQYAEKAHIKNAFDFYEKLTTHDSSLSSCIYGIVASKCGYTDKAYAFFKESIALDLEDTHHNTKDGLHMANIAGSILSVIAGFAGLKVSENGICLDPHLPKAWSSLQFNLEYKSRLISIKINDETVKCRLIKGQPISIKINEEVQLLSTSSKPYKGIIFDLDGVLTETSHAHFQAWKTLAESMGIEVPDTLEDQVRGISRRASLDLVLAHSKEAVNLTDEDKEILASRKNAIYLDQIAHYSPNDLCEGAEALLEALKAKGYKIALASASKNAPFLLKAMDIAHYFDAVVNPAEIKAGKPAPDIFLKACEMLSLEPSVCIGIEDAFAGIESIKAAGILPIGIGKPDVLYNSDIVLSDLKALLTLLT